MRRSSPCRFDISANDFSVGHTALRTAVQRSHPPTLSAEKLNAGVSQAPLRSLLWTLVDSSPFRAPLSPYALFCAVLHPDSIDEADGAGSLMDTSAALTVRAVHLEKSMLRHRPWSPFPRSCTAQRSSTAQRQMFWNRPKGDRS